MPIFVDLAGFVVIVVAVIRVVTTDTDLWRRRQWSKAAWVLLAVLFVWSTRLGALPVGAALAIWKTHRLLHPIRRGQAVDPCDVPFADGIPVPFERPTADPSSTEGDA